MEITLTIKRNADACSTGCPFYTPGYCLLFHEKMSDTEDHDYECCWSCDQLITAAAGQRGIQ